MITLSTFLFVYVLGGLTFIPLILAAIFCHAYLTFPVNTGEPLDDENVKINNGEERNHGDLSKSELASLPEQLKPRIHEPDAAAGYFAVCREYVPGGIHGKPPERTTPAGAVVATESPSVYQSMYRSIFDRNKSTAPTIDGGNGKAKKARNVFFVVLRLGHLMLYDDSEHIDVRHVISLAYYDIDIYAGGEKIPEGELWIKRNCIRLTKKSSLGDTDSNNQPFYLFSDNCSEKEDFYLAMLRNKEHQPGSPSNPPTPLQFDTAHIVKLVQQLHASEDNLQTRWLNALIGRIFLGLYKTSDIEDLIRTKITKKISRVPKPNFITNITLQKIEMGDLAPFFTNPKLKELTVDGDLTLEADVKYKGNFRLEIAAVARIDLGQRFKAREVTIILAGILKRLEGHLLVRIKPPPSNRIWISFEQPPKMEMTLEPIVSSRQITYGVILRAMESRIREVMGETLVFPNWDDIPFSDSTRQRFRGGIWEDDVNLKPLADAVNGTVNLTAGTPEEKDTDSEDMDSLPGPGLISRDKTMSMPAVADAPSTGLFSRKSAKSNKSTISLDGAAGSTGVSSGADTKTPAKPKAMRSGSFASVAAPVVNMNLANVEALKSQGGKSQQDAATAMKTISKSQPNSPLGSPVGSPEQPNMMEEVARSITKEGSLSSKASSQASKEEETKDGDSLESGTVAPSSPSLHSVSDTASVNSFPTKPRHASSLSLPRNMNSAEKRQAINQSLISATAAAKKWFATRQQQSEASSPTSAQDTTPDHQSHDDAQSEQSASPIAHPSPQNPTFRVTSGTPSPLGSPAHPIGRGQPLPPPGTPLPMPKDKRNSTWSAGASALANLAKRKPVPPARPSVSAGSDQPQTSVLSNSTSPPKEPTLPPQAAMKERSNSATSNSSNRRKSSSVTSLPPLPPRRKRSSVTQQPAVGVDGDGMLVIEAPEADRSAPPSPMKEEMEEAGMEAEQMPGTRTGVKAVDEANQKRNGERQVEVVGRGEKEEADDGDDGDDGVFQKMDIDA